MAPPLYLVLLPFFSRSFPPSNPNPPLSALGPFGARTTLTPGTGVEGVGLPAEAEAEAGRDERLRPFLLNEAEEEGEAVLASARRPSPDFEVADARDSFDSPSTGAFPAPPSSPIIRLLASSYAFSRSV
jgi:hypothetical protein